MQHPRSPQQCVNLSMSIDCANVVTECLAHLWRRCRCSDCFLDCSNFKFNYAKLSSAIGPVGGRPGPSRGPGPCSSQSRAAASTFTMHMELGTWSSHMVFLPLEVVAVAVASTDRLYRLHRLGWRWWWRWLWLDDSMMPPPAHFVIIFMWENLLCVSIKRFSSTLLFSFFVLLLFFFKRIQLVC